MSDAIDRGRIGAFAMEAIDSIVEEFENDGAVVRGVGDLMLIVEVQTEEGEHGKSHVMYYASELRPHTHFGLLRAATLASEGRVDADG